jgi:hypothetical protein
MMGGGSQVGINPLPEDDYDMDASGNNFWDDEPPASINPNLGYNNFHGGKGMAYGSMPPPPPKPVPQRQAPAPKSKRGGGGAAVAGGSKVCRIVGCTDNSIARRPYCFKHSGSRQCEYAGPGGCAKCAQGSTRFCIAHGGGRRCTHSGCDKGARDK